MTTSGTPNTNGKHAGEALSPAQAGHIDAIASDAHAMGEGGVWEDPHHRRADLRMRERAIREGWIMPDKGNQDVPQRMRDIAVNDPDSRVAVMAGKVYATMHGQNQDSLHKAADALAPAAKSPPPAAGIGTQVNIVVDRPLSREARALARKLLGRTTEDPAFNGDGSTTPPH